ncbi:MAG: hypothetical protein K8G79_05640 [bacterium]|uniref:Uncharacterized protein n=1 Tax=Candidatus Methylomirabilis tolerans TaxID=3123416 RepID=A0AAJ1AK04_9BACT|nr:hypothetical protein [Candidatus Methylomirabilis sp.]
MTGRPLREVQLTLGLTRGNKRPVGEDVAASAKSHNLSRRQGGAIVAIFQVGLLYSAGAVLALVFREEVVLDIFLLFLSLWGALCFFMLWRRIDWGNYRFLSFGALFLLTSACFRVSSFLDVLFFGNRIERWPIYADEPLLFIAYGEFTFVAGALILVGTWLALRGHEHSIVIIKSWRYDRSILIIGYAIGVSVVFSIRILEFDLAFLGSILYVFFIMAMLSILLISLGSSQGRTWRRCVLLPLLLSFPLIYGALGTGMKENIIFSVLPVAIGVFVVAKGAWTRTFVGLLMAAVFAFMTVFVSIQRDINWIEGQGRSAVQVFDITVDAFRLDNNLWATAVENSLSRKNLLEVNGWSFAIVEHRGHVKEFSPDHAYQIFIPRVLWVEKPQFRPGSDFSDLVYGRGMGDYTATAAGFFSALYLGAGLWGVLIYSMMLGALYAVSLSVVIRFGSSFAQLLLLSGAAYKALRLDEGWPVYEFAGSISLLLMVILLGKLISFFQKSTRRVRV